VFLDVGGSNKSIGVQTPGAVKQVIDGLDYFQVRELVVGERSEPEERHVMPTPVVRWETHGEQNLT